MSTIDLDHIAAQVPALLKKTGQFITEEFQRFSFDQVDYKAENDPFTFVDVEADKRLTAGCAALLPGSGFLNEELEGRPSENGYRWIIDPIDGTANFTHGVPHFCTSLALTYEDELLLGYVYEPVFGQLFHARKGAGAFLNGQPLAVNQRTQIGNALVATGFPYAKGEWLHRYLKVLAEVQFAAQGVRRFGSAALDLAYVAAGRLGGFYEVDLKPWDVAAGALLVTEAGGKVTDFSGGGQYLFGRQLIASNGHIHEDLGSILRKNGFATPV
ncbi:MAG: inositol monophosphatase [Bacteroidetes bacterium]|nr:MAG: inositol monophosphatase [Bacteroidota bacterium]